MDCTLADFVIFFPTFVPFSKQSDQEMKEMNGFASGQGSSIWNPVGEMGLYNLSWKGNAMVG